MPAQKSAFLKLAAVGFAIALGAVPLASYGVDPGSGQAAIPTTNVQLPNPFTGGALPPALQGGAAAQLAAKFSSCINSGGAMGILDGVVGSSKSTGRSTRSRVSSGTKLEDPCTTADGKTSADDVGDSKNLECSLLQTNGAYDPKQLKLQLESIEGTVALLACKESKLKKVKEQLSCLTVQANQITQQVNSLQETVAGSIRKMQKDVGDLVSQAKDRESQILDINNKLGGDKSNGAEGLIDLQKRTRAVVDEMEVATRNVKEAQIKNARGRASIVEQSKKRTSALTRECFTTQTKAEFRCYPAGTAAEKNPALSASQYLSCRYRDTQTRVNSRGRIERNNAQAALGNKRADELDALIGEIFGGASKSAQPSNKEDEFRQQLDEIVTIFTPADVERLYGARLRSFDGKGIPVHDYVMKYIGQCYQRATVAVNNERTRINSSLAQAEEVVRSQERETSQGVKIALAKVAQQYAENMKGLSGDTAPLDVSRCNDAAPAIQANCMEEALSNLRAQLTGVTPSARPTTSNYSGTILIKGNSAKTNIPITCAGLDGCISRLQNYSTALQREQQRIDSFKTEYAQQGYRNVEELLQKARTQLQPQSEALRNQLKSLNEALATLGVEDTVKIDDIADEELTADDRPEYAGIPKIPTSLLAVIGSKMQPKLLNVSGDNYSSALSGVAQASTSIQEKVSKAAEFQRKLGPLAEKCKSEEMKEAAKALKADANSYVGCVPELCEQKTAQDTGFRSLMNEISRISTLKGLSSLSETSDILSSGLSQCNRVHETWNGKLSKVERTLAEALEDSKKADLEIGKANTVLTSLDVPGLEGQVTQLEDQLANLRNKERTQRAIASTPATDSSTLAGQIQDKEGELSKKKAELTKATSQKTAAEANLTRYQEAQTKAERERKTAEEEKEQLLKSPGSTGLSSCEGISRNLRDKFGELRDRHKQINSDAGVAF